jgi:serine/threonine protein kinase
MKMKNMSQKGLTKLVRSLSQKSLLTTHVGTSTYLSPEQESDKPYNEKVDIFALGLILCELCCKFSTSHERIATLNDLKNKGLLPAKVKSEYPIES